MVFKPGQSGNPLGRPSGSRNRFSEAFMRDLAETWQAHGAEAMQKAALTDPVRFIGVAATLIPKDVQVTLSGRLESGLDDADRDLMIGILRAVREAVPQADKGRQLQFAIDAIRLHSAPIIAASDNETESQNAE